MSEEDIHLPSEDDTFFDKDHIVFYTDESGEIKCRYFSINTEVFQDLMLSILSGAINDGTMNFLIDDFTSQGMKEDALAMIMVKRLLNSNESTPVVKPSNFR